MFLTWKFIPGKVTLIYFAGKNKLNRSNVEKTQVPQAVEYEPNEQRLPHICSQASQTGNSFCGQIFKKSMFIRPKYYLNHTMWFCLACTCHCWFVQAQLCFQSPIKGLVFTCAIDKEFPVHLSHTANKHTVFYVYCS